MQKLQRSQFGRRAERLDDDQLQLGFEDLGVDIARAEATLPSVAVNSSRARSQTDRPSLPAHLPREEMRLDLEHQACPAAVALCMHCGAKNRETELVGWVDGIRTATFPISPRPLAQPLRDEGMIILRSGRAGMSNNIIQKRLAFSANWSGSTSTSGR